MKHLFYVHDNQDSPSERKRALEEAGFRVTMLRNGESCLAQLHKERPDLLLIDALLEGTNGFELCRQVRAKYAARILPIILSSEIYRARVFREDAENAGAQRFILRPIKLESLVEHIEGVLEGQAPGSSAKEAAA